jgi:hypothetical protein
VPCLLGGDGAAAAAPDLRRGGEVTAGLEERKRGALVQRREAGQAQLGRHAAETPLRAVEGRAVRRHQIVCHSVM